MIPVTAASANTNLASMQWQPTLSWHGDENLPITIENSTAPSGGGGGDDDGGQRVRPFSRRRLPKTLVGRFN